MFYCSFVSIHYIICECGDTFPTEEALKLHLERDHHKKLEENEYKCETCEKVFASARACLIHQRVHSAPRREVREPRREVREPRREVREPREAPARDPGDVARERREKRQKRAYHNKNIVCEVCGKRYSSNAALGYHQRAHTGERPYQCSLCPKNFTMPLFLQIHTRTHTGERPYECPHCPKAFSNKAALLRHDRVHTGVKPYGCPKCGKHFTQSNSMKLHVRTVHLKLPAPYKSKTRRQRDLLRKQQRAEKFLASNNLSDQLDVQVEVQQAMLKAEVKAEVEGDGDGDGEGESYHVYYDEAEYEEGAEMYQEVEIGHPEITMYEVGDQNNVQVLYKEDELKGEVLYEMEEGGEEVLYEEGDTKNEMLEVLYEGEDDGEGDMDDGGDVQYEEVYEEAI